MVGNLDALTTVFTEFYYWVTVVFMFLIHVGFCMYEVGASRRKNHLHTLMKNIMIKMSNACSLVHVHLIMWICAPPGAKTGIP